MWRIVGLLTALCVLLVSAPLRADEADAKALLDRALEALGGVDKLEKLPAASWKTRGSFRVGETKIELTNGDFSVQEPDCYRWEVEVTVNERAVTGMLVLGKGKGWLKGGNGEPQDLAKLAEKQDVNILRILQHDFGCVRLAQRLL